MSRLLFAVIVGLFALSANARNVDVLMSLATRDFAALDAYIDGLEAGFSKREVSERELIDAFRPFYKQDDILSAKFNEWVEKRPTSYGAVLARGVYRRKLGELGRGRKTVNLTPTENLDYMHKQFELAKEDFRAAQQLRPGTYLVAVNLLNVAQFEGDEAGARRYLDLANKAYPQNFIARARYLTTLRPRWGGSQAMMRSFIEESSTHGASEQQVRWLKAIQYEDLGSDTFAQGDRKKTREYLVEALSLSADADDGFRANYLEFASWFCFGPERQDESSCQRR